jgi:dCTP deaminase
VVLASTLEHVRIPRTVACDLKLKSTLGRLWINHSLAGWCDPGFQGNITLELQNLGPSPFVLEAGRRIAQLIFIAMEAEPEVAYGEPGSSSHYQGQTGTTPARG